MIQDDFAFLLQKLNKGVPQQVIQQLGKQS